MRMVSNIGDDFQQTVSVIPTWRHREDPFDRHPKAIDIMYKNPPLLQTIVGI